MRKIILLLLVTSLLLSACQAANPSPTVAPVSTEPVQESAPSEPEQGIQVYPEPTEPQAQPTEPPAAFSYPQPQGAVSWEEAQTLILEGNVAQAFQFNSLMVILVLEDGQVLQTFEPEFDDVMEVIEQCGDACSDMVVATE